MLAEQGRGETVIEPRTHLFPGRAEGHFNVLRGVAADYAGVKVVGDFVDNHRPACPPSSRCCCLMDPATGAPAAIIDATAITEMRTGAVTAIGAEVLAAAMPGRWVISAPVELRTGTFGCCAARYRDSRRSASTPAAPRAARRSRGA